MKTIRYRNSCWLTSNVHAGSGRARVSSRSRSRAFGIGDRKPQLAFRCRRRRPLCQGETENRTAYPTPVVPCSATPGAPGAQAVCAGML
jgi:hypothetical protein